MKVPDFHFRLLRTGHVPTERDRHCPTIISTRSWLHWWWMCHWRGCRLLWSPCCWDHCHGWALSSQSSPGFPLELNSKPESQVLIPRAISTFAKNVICRNKKTPHLTKPGQEFLFLGLCAVRIDRVHDQWWLDAHDWPIAAVHSLHLSGNQAICHITSARTAITCRRNK